MKPDPPATTILATTGHYGREDASAVLREFFAAHLPC